MSRYSRLLFSRTPETPGAVAARLRHRAACDAAVVDREAKYPSLTAENAREAMAYQEERIRFHEEVAK